MRLYKGTVDVTNCYKTNNAGSNGTLCVVTSTVPFDLGTLKQDYGIRVKAYDNGICYDDTYYMLPATLSGSGTEKAPYLIRSVYEWDSFTLNVNNYSGKYVQLAEDISVSTMAGTSEANSFQGTFLGNGHTITANISDTNNQGTALFRYINGATIKDLTVGGTITGGMHAAAIVGFAQGTGNSIRHIGGILGHGTTSDIAISGCVFSGTMTGGGTAKGAIVGWGESSGTKSVTDCLYLMADGQNTGGLDLVRMNKGTVSVTNCYKTTSVGSNGKYTYAYTTAPANLGDLVQEYGMLKAYENAILYDGTYYVAPASISLADNADNSTTISDKDGYVADVTLTGRTLYKDGAWNTLCLPFNVTLAGSPLEGAVARPLTEGGISGTTLNLTFGEAVTELVAGTPYIIKWDGGDNIVSPVFSGVTIDATMHPYDSGEADGDQRVRFTGTYSSMEFGETDNSILLMGGENMLYYPTTGAGLGAQHAYFKIGGDGAKARRITGFSIDFGDSETTGIISAEANSSRSDWYTIHGVKLDGKPTRSGIYINGGRKVVIK